MLMQDPFKESERVFCWVYLSMNYCLREEQQRKETWRLGGMGEWEKQQELHNGERKTCSGIIIAAHHHDGVMRSGAQFEVLRIFMQDIGLNQFRFSLKPHGPPLLIKVKLEITHGLQQSSFFFKIGTIMCWQ